MIRQYGYIRKLRISIKKCKIINLKYYNVDIDILVKLVYN